MTPGESLPADKDQVIWCESTEQLLIGPQGEIVSSDVLCQGHKLTLKLNINLELATQTQSNNS